MKKIKLFVVGIMFLQLCIVYNVNAQAKKNRRISGGMVTPVKVGSVILNIGIGTGVEYENAYYNPSFGTKVAVEWGLWHAGPGVITLGAQMGGSFSGGGVNFERNYDDYTARTIVVAARSAWHYGWKVKGLDTYGGFSAGLGFDHYNYSSNGNADYNKNRVIPVLGAFVGASYFITPKFGFNAEAGYDITSLQLGVVFKLK